MFMFVVIHGHIPAVIIQLLPLLSSTSSMLTRQHNVNLKVSRCTLNGYKYFIVHNEPLFGITCQLT